jgi:branched-subunit amino acid aminotransferase/4-amino-4-deoxychorismate lyase
VSEMVYLNGKLVPRDEARISVDDHGFLYGYGLFETMRAYNGRIFLLENHLTRLLKSATKIGPDLSGLDLAQACRETLSANGLQSARLRLTVTHGDSAEMPWLMTSGPPTVVITAREYRPLSPDAYRQGYRVVISSCRQFRHSPLSGIKPTSYLVNILARREAISRGFDEALLLNEDGCITEGSTSNVFFVGSSGLVTPPLESGILPGITRDLLIELAVGLGIAVAEENVTPADFPRFRQAFLTASTLEIMPLSSIVAEDMNTTVFHSNGPGEIIPRLMTAYRERVAEETGFHP